MVTDPSLCPIPPGFEVIGGFNDDFVNFKRVTGYDNFRSGDGIHNNGVSYRWKNSNIRSDGIVCGFQFKIGPHPGVRWTVKEGPFGIPSNVGIPANERINILDEVFGGDINVHFPRRDGPGGARGGYIATLQWWKSVEFSDNPPLLTQGEMGKEIPHGNYFENNLIDDNQFKIKIPNVLSQANPRTNLENPAPDKELVILDGEWHSFLAIAYNDWYFRFEPDPQDPTIGRLKGSPELLPVIGLWYSDTPTTNFNDFKLVGMGMDLGNMPMDLGNRGPLKEAIGDDQNPILNIDDVLVGPFLNSFTDILDPVNEVFFQGIGSINNLLLNNATGDQLSLAEHALQIRIDDVPSNELEIRNMYAASVRHIGIRAPQNLAFCRAEAKAVNDVQAKIDDLKKKREEAKKNDTSRYRIWWRRI